MGMRILKHEVSLGREVRFDRGITRKFGVNGNALVEPFDAEKDRYLSLAEFRIFLVDGFGGPHPISVRSNERFDFWARRIPNRGGDVPPP